MHKRPAFKSYRAFVGFVTILLIVTALYLARDFFIPLALAGLFAFMLSPLVRRLCGWGVPRTLSVAMVSIFVFGVLGLVFWLLGQQAAQLASELPNYRQNIEKRVHSVKEWGDTGFIKRLSDFGANLGGGSFDGRMTEGQADGSSPPAPSFSPNGAISKALNTLLSMLANGLGVAGVIVVIVIFVLLRQEDLSNRIVRLAGYNRLTTTTRALDEAGERVSQYLLMQCTVNGIYGVLLAVSLAIVGLPYIILWGVLAALFRYIPYLGPVIVAFLPISFSLAYFDGWTQPLIVIGIIVVLELVTNMILEPVLYGKSTGVSDLSIIIALTFWTWLWGGIGLVLATPLTVCLVVIAKYIASLRWIDILMGDSPKIQPHLSYYQHLISEESDLAQNTVEDAIEKHGLEKSVETLILPVLVLTRHEFALDRLSKEEYDEIHHNVERTLEFMEEQQQQEEEKAGPDAEEKLPSITIFARALRGKDDELALRSLAAILPSGIEVRISHQPHLIGELIQEIEKQKPDLICISIMPPEGAETAVILCRRVRSRLPNLKILACHWSMPGDESDDRSLREAGAAWVANSTGKAVEIIKRFAEGG